jgi:hypothetical protein
VYEPAIASGSPYWDTPLARTEVNVILSDEPHSTQHASKALKVRPLQPMTDREATECAQHGEFSVGVRIITTCLQVKSRCLCYFICVVLMPSFCIIQSRVTYFSPTHERRRGHLTPGKSLITASGVRQDTNLPLAQETVLNESTTSAQTDSFVQEGTNITISASLVPSQRGQSPANQISVSKATTKSALIPK